MHGKSAAYMVLHADLCVRSMDAALEFYCSKLGFSCVDDALLKGPMIEYRSHGLYSAMRVVLLRVSSVGAMIELQEYQSDSSPTTKSLEYLLQAGMVSILVADLDSHIKMARNKGVFPASEVFLVQLPRQGHCKVAFYNDLDGNILEFVQMTHAGYAAMRNK
jgi:catechol 2,3-dioxygenase-like lactoylglutathione lyase family enzyme